MKAIVVTDRPRDAAGMTLAERPEPQAAINDVVVAGSCVGIRLRLSWRGPRPGPIAATVTGHRRSLGTSWPEWSPHSATARRGCRSDSGSFGLADWHRDGTLAEYVAIEARNLAPLPGDVDFTVGASLPISGLTAWQGLFQHGRLQAGQSVLAHGAAGAVGTMVTQLAREAGAYVIGTGRAADRQKALDFGAQEFVDLDNDAAGRRRRRRPGVRRDRRRHPEAVRDADPRRRNAGDHHGPRSRSCRRPGGGVRPRWSSAAQLTDGWCQRVRDGRLAHEHRRAPRTLDDADRRPQPSPARAEGKTIIQHSPVGVGAPLGFATCCRGVLRTRSCRSVPKDRCCPSAASGRSCRSGPWDRSCRSVRSAPGCRRCRCSPIAATAPS